MVAFGASALLLGAYRRLFYAALVLVLAERGLCVCRSTYPNLGYPARILGSPTTHCKLLQVRT